MMMVIMRMMMLIVMIMIMIMLVTSRNLHKINLHRLILLAGWVSFERIPRFWEATLASGRGYWEGIGDTFRGVLVGIGGYWWVLVLMATRLPW